MALAVFFKPQTQRHLPETLPTEMQPILVDMSADAPAVPAPPQRPPAAALGRLIELDEFIFLGRFGIQLLEHFGIFAVAHFTVPRLPTAGQKR